MHSPHQCLHWHPCMLAHAGATIHCQIHCCCCTPSLGPAVRTQLFSMPHCSSLFAFPLALSIELLLRLSFCTHVMLSRSLNLAHQYLSSHHDESAMLVKRKILESIYCLHLFPSYHGMIVLLSHRTPHC
jgi:hypothetical protein